MILAKHSWKPSAKAGWEHFPHGADVGVRGFGPTIEAAFEQAACALTAVVADLPSVAITTRVAIGCAADDHELLLYDWLNAIVYEMATREMLFGRFEIAIDGLQLSGAAWGEPVDRRRHEPAVEIKGATYTALKVEQDETGRWVAQCVVDV